MVVVPRPPLTRRLRQLLVACGERPWHVAGMTHASVPLEVGLVGAGRSRNGLGPFLSRYLEQHGLRVAVVSGRNEVRAAVAAGELAAALGHPVRAAADAEALCGDRIKAVVIASPAEYHTEALAAALRWRLPCLCEKPVAAPGQLQHARGLLDGFLAAGLLLVENCQWPHVLPAFAELHGCDPRARTPQTLDFGLSPSVVGPAMLPDSLPHLLSLVDALVPAGAEVELAAVSQSDAGAQAAHNRVVLRFAWRDGELEARLHLQHSSEQPRPAWLALDGLRMDRRIESDYRICFIAGDRVVRARDPLEARVADFADSVRAVTSGSLLATDAAASVLRRLDWLARALDLLVGPGGPG